VTDIPPTWIAAQAVHLAPQIVERHSVSAHELASQVQFLSIDPSPHYSRGLLPQQLYDLLSAATAFLPSQAEVEHLSGAGAWADIVMDLVRAGFAEVIVKRGSAGCLVATSLSDPQLLPVAPANPVDLTGAGDAFSGAYTVNRAMGVAPVEAAMRASVSAAMIIECSGTEEAFRLVPAEAERRFNNYRAEEKR
jgi:sugar/nucleoside kinase (ribokinase family)